MKSFHFRLQRVLEWREHRLELELRKQQHLKFELKKVADDLAAIRRAMLQGCPPEATGADLAALQRYLDRLYREDARLEKRRMELNAAITMQNAVVVAKDRDVKVLERLKEQALKSWQKSADKEIEELAGENAINRWGRD